MSKIERITKAVTTVRGRKFNVDEIVWKHHEGRSYDVSDTATGLELHNESFDEDPGVEGIERLLDQIKQDLEYGHLESILVGEETTLYEILGIDDPREPEPEDMSGGSGGSTDR